MSRPRVRSMTQRGAGRGGREWGRVRRFGGRCRDRLPSGKAVGADLWAGKDQSGNRPEITLANAAAAGVARTGWRCTRPTWLRCLSRTTPSTW